MTLEEIEKAWMEDVEINQVKLQDESLKIPKLHSKYYNILTREKIVLYKNKQALEEKEYIFEQFFLKTLTQEEIIQYGLVEYSSKKYMKSDVHKAINTIPEIKKLKEKVGLQNIKIDFLESIIKQINNRNWLIRDVIEIRKFENGSN